MTWSSSYLFFVCVVWFLFAQFIAVHADVDGQGRSWLPINQTELNEVYSSSFNLTSAREQALAQVIAEKQRSLQNQPNKLERYNSRMAPWVDALLPEDKIYLLTNPNFSLPVLIAGDGEKIHTIRMMVPLVNYTREEQELGFSFLSDIHEKIFGFAWTAARTWPRDSLEATWTAAAERVHEESAVRRRNEMLITHQVDGLTAATFGVPPDLVIYTITVRERCIPNLDEITRSLGFICVNN